VGGGGPAALRPRGDETDLGDGVSAWVSLELDRPDATFRPGDVVSGRFAAKWKTRARAARAQLNYVETTDLGTVVRRRGPRVELPGGELAGGATHPFSLTLPADAAPTLLARDLATGRTVGTVSWHVELRLDRFGPDDVASEAITVELARCRCRSSAPRSSPA
jgi:hypothetical protein